MVETIRIVQNCKVENINLADYVQSLADCIVMSCDNEIVLQKRPNGSITAFGGHIEKSEFIVDAAIRELKEELGAKITPSDLVYLGSMTESFSEHKDIVNLFFWYDRGNTITGCYEWDEIRFNDVASALQNPDLMDYLRWGLEQCREKGLLS